MSIQMQEVFGAKDHCNAVREADVFWCYKMGPKDPFLNDQRLLTILYTSISPEQQQVIQLHYICCTDIIKLQQSYHHL